MPTDYRITHVVTRIRGVAHELQRLHFSGFHRPSASWQPAMNVYLREDQLDVCLDLAGVSADAISISLEGRNLLVQGKRSSPDYQIDDLHSSCRQILAMEIESGTFQRALKLPVLVDRENVRAENKDGMLWIHLPVLRPSAMRVSP